MKKAIYAGSFDPVTYGHIEIVSKACKLFDKLYVLVAHNPSKNHYLSIDERIELMKSSLDEDCVEVMSLPYGETVAYQAQKMGVSHLVRGLRGHTDIDDEMATARINREITRGLETVIFVPEIYHEELSSSVVRGMVGLRNWRKILEDRVPPQVIRKLEVIHFKSLLGKNDTNFGWLCNELDCPYHNIHHSYNVLDAVYYDANSDQEKEAIVWAAAYRDIRKTEKQSFGVFSRQSDKFFDISHTVIQRVSQLILGTDHSKVLSGDQLNDETLCRFVAADLMILASNEMDYAKYTENLRKEYDHFSDKEWREGRIEFLQKMMQPLRSSIFPANGMFEEEESRAISNIARELCDLRESSEEDNDE